MSEACSDLKNVFYNILVDIMSMSASVIKKSDICLKDIETLDLDSLSTVSDNIRILLDRVNTNVTSFAKTFDAALETYQQAREIEKSQPTKVETTASQESPRRKLNLSLRKNGSTQESDPDLTNSKEGDANPRPSIAKRRLELSDLSAPSTSSTNNEVSKPEESVIKEVDIDESASDTDSEKTVQYFDVPTTNGPGDDWRESGEDLGKALEELDKIQGDCGEENKKRNILRHTTESMSFDFDTDDDFTTEMQKRENLDEKHRIETRQQAQKDNHELLEMLRKAVDSTSQERPHTEEDVEHALKILEAEASSSSMVDSDESDDDAASVVMSSAESGDEPQPIFTHEDRSDIESVAEEEAPEYELKTLSIMPRKLDEMDDAEIEKLCNENNINKRKCAAAINRVKRKKRKRIRVVSSSSSSSSSESSYQDAIIPELPLDTEERCPVPRDDDLADVTALADELVDKLDTEDADEDVEMSSLSSTDMEDDSSKEEEKKAEETIEEPKKDVEPEVKEENDEKVEEEPKPPRKQGSWRSDFMLWTDSENEYEPELLEVIVNDDPLKDKRESNGTENKDKKDVQQPKIISDVTTIISDSDSSDSDEVTFIDEVQGDDGGHKGRRNIRAILSDHELNELTQKAKTEEDARIQRLEEHSKTIESIQSQHEDFVLDFDVKTGEALVTVDYNLAEMLKPHQKEGVQFMWEACYESVEMLKTKPGTGCILAHCMGLGKTLQVITLITTLFKHPVTNTKHVLIICPLSTVMNWKNEIRHAFTKLSEPPNIRVYFIVKEDLNMKLNVIRSWRKSGGILVMGYECFQILTDEKMSSRVSVQDKKLAFHALLDPGPDLIVCDEGHQLKNGKTLKTKAVMKVRTKRRIVLTGTPLQNNLKEYYWMVHFVKPHLLGTPREYSNRFETPIKNGQYHDSGPDDIKIMKKRTHVLAKILKKTVHRVEVSVLSAYLPDLTDYTIFIKLTPLQIQLYTSYVNMVTANSAITNSLYFHDATVLGLCNLHPYALHIYYSKPRPKQKKKKKKLDEDVPNEDEQEENGLDLIGRECRDWYKSLLPEDVATNVNYSSKLRAILDTIDESIRIGEKALVFAKNLAELDLLEHFLKTQGTTNMRCWRPTIDYYRIDGQTPVEQRDELCKNFNAKSSVRIFILTHRVGGLGLNLTGANRVIMIGSNHNPSLDTQSMYRVYRFGQQKKCFIYRLLTLGTMEEKIYNRCVVKLHLSGTVIDKLHFGRLFKEGDFLQMYKIEFDRYDHERPIPVVPSDKLLALVLQNVTDIYKYYLHNSLLENRPEEELTDEDKKQAWEEFNNEKAERNNAPNLVPNPMSNNMRGMIPRGFQPNGMRPNINNQFNRPGPSQSNPQTNPFYQLLDPHRAHTSGYNRRISNTLVQTARDVLQNFERMRTVIPPSERLQNFANVIRDRSRDVPVQNETPSGEFNYALNKVV